MKKATISICLFLVAFAAAYLSLCYCVPGWQIKLEADALTYFVESVKKLALVKCLLSSLAGLIVSLIPLLVEKLRFQVY